MDFSLLSKPLKVAAVAEQIAHLLPEQYSPIRSNGYGNQGAYLAEISKMLAKKVMSLADPKLLPILDQSILRDEESSTISDPLVIIDWEDALQASIIESSSISETTREALIYARRGQGKFKQNVAKIEHACRVTGVDNRIHLIASHIKPWREASNEERLDGSNGLLLTPSIDHLFDRGFISFEDTGDLLLSPVADRRALARMGVNLESPPVARTFNSDQCHFLDYHRKEVFLKSAM